MAPKQLPRSSCSPKSLKAEKLLQLRTAGCLRLERGQRYLVLDQHGAWTSWSPVVPPTKGRRRPELCSQTDSGPNVGPPLLQQWDLNLPASLSRKYNRRGPCPGEAYIIVEKTISDVKTNNRHSLTVGECCERQGDSESDGGLFSAGWKGKRWWR